MSEAKSKIWVGQWGPKRHVVFDPSIQPVSDEFILLYFVQGHQLCVRARKDRSKLNTVRNPDELSWALEQYQTWLFANQKIIDTKKSTEPLQLEPPPAPRKKCDVCGGSPNWTDNEGNRVTYGSGNHSEGPNILERCNACNGKGFVDDVL